MAKKLCREKKKLKTKKSHVQSIQLPIIKNMWDVTRTKHNDADLKRKPLQLIVFDT